MRVTVLTVLVLLAAATAVVSGIDTGRLRHRKASASRVVHHSKAAAAAAAEDAIHNERAERMVDELENGDSSLLDAMERSVDERLLATKKELASVTDFRKRAMKLLQSKLASLAAGGDDGSSNAAAQIRAAIAQGKSLSAAYDQSPIAGGDDFEQSLDDAETAAANTQTPVLHSDPINELLSLDAQEMEARSALDSETERFQSLQGESDAAEEAAVDSSLDDSISQLKANLTAIQQQRTELFRHERLHPERLLRVNAAGGAARIDALRLDLEKLRNELSIDAVYAAPAATATDGEAGGSDAAAASAFGAKQSLASWIALIEAEIADSAGHSSRH